MEREAYSFSTKRRLNEGRIAIYQKVDYEIFSDLAHVQ